MRKPKVLVLLVPLTVVCLAGCREAIPTAPAGEADLSGQPYGNGPTTIGHGPWFHSEMAVSRFINGVGIVFIIEANGPGVRQLTDGTMISQRAEWSPEGTWIAFSARPIGAQSGGDIYIMPADGSAGPARITTTGGITPCWLNDKEIVYASSGGDLYAQGVSGGQAGGSPPRQIIAHPGSDWAPSCSTDGGWIAFHSNRDGNWHIYVVDKDGNNLRKVTDSQFGELYPAWSPRGDRIAFSSRREGNNYDIYVINTDGTGERRLTTHPSWDRLPEWSRDGKRIAFESYRSSHVWSIAPDGSDLIEHTNSPGRVPDDWSP